jgi:hypothetical protein
LTRRWQPTRPRFNKRRCSLRRCQAHSSLPSPHPGADALGGHASGPCVISVAGPQGEVRPRPCRHGSRSPMPCGG